MKEQDFNYSKEFGLWELAAMLDFCYKRKLTTENSLLIEKKDGTRVLYFN